MPAELITHLLDLLADTHWARRVRARRMFGGYGLYCDERMCGLIAGEMLYLKTDSISRPEFTARGLSPFTYEKKGKPMALSYYLAPPETLEDGAELAQWLNRAAQAAARAAAEKRRKPARRVKA